MKTPEECYREAHRHAPFGAGKPDQYDLAAMDLYASQFNGMSPERRDTMSMDVYNIARRLRQINNSINNPVLSERMLQLINQLNLIGTEIGGGAEVMIGKVLRS